MEIMREELQKPTYEFKVPLAKDISLLMRQVSCSHKPENNLLLGQLQNSYRLQITPVSSSLQVVHTALEALANDEVELHIHKGDNNGYAKISSPHRIDVTCRTEDLEARDYERVREKALDKANAYWQKLYTERMRYLYKCRDSFTPKYQSFVKELVMEAADKDRNLIRIFDSEAEEVDQLEDVLNPEPVVRLQGLFYNFITFGSYKRQRRKDMKAYAIRDVAWQVLGYAAREGAERLREDAHYIKRHIDDETFAQDLRNLSTFYGNLSTSAFRGQSRMRALLNRAGHLYWMSNRLTTPDAEAIGKIALNRALGYNFK